MKTNQFIIMTLLMASVALPLFAAEQEVQTDSGMLDTEIVTNVFPKKPAYSPYVGRNFPTRPFFGDTHLHTSISVDAGAFGCRLSPVDAYRFARGEEIVFFQRPAGQAVPTA